MTLKGVLLAGGNGSRLFPLTLVTNKHLLPVHDRPMVFYPLQTLRDMGCREVMVVVGGRSVGDILELLHDGTDIGLDLTFRYQRGALGIAHAISLTRAFVGEDPLAVVLGDNIINGSLRAFADEFLAGSAEAGAVLTRVADPERFGVAEFDERGQVVGFDEKPTHPKSDRIPIGAYLFRPGVFEVLAGLKPSARGEFEITDVLNHYVRRGTLASHEFEGEWMDAGTIDALLLANNRLAGLRPPPLHVRADRIEQVMAEAVDPSQVHP
ncbi:MAG: sugar phosphate nucleotidyltransferase [Chloroflexota bacterium]